MESKVKLLTANPHEKSNFLAKLFLTWNFRLFRQVYKQGFSVKDLWKARGDDISSRLGDRLEEAWRTEVENARKHKVQPSFSKAIVRTFWVEYLLKGLIVALLFIIIWPLIPFTLGMFVDYFSMERTAESYQKAHIFNFLMNLCSVLSLVFYNNVALSQGIVGMRVRVACCSLMYRKILKLNHVGLSKTEVGQVINLMSNDVSRFDMSAVFLNYLWVAPISMPVVSYLVWRHIQAATLAALLVIFVQTVLVQVYLSNVQGKYRGKIAKRTDERVKVMNELISGIEVIKMYTWEKPFAALVDRLRKAEVNNVLKTSLVKGFSMALNVFTERLILFAAIVTFVLLGGDIRAQTTFSLVQYFNLMQLMCNILFPFGLSCLAESKVSVRRIEEFLLLDEQDIPMIKTGTALIPNVQLSGDNEKEKLLSQYQDEDPDGIFLTNVTASWRDDAMVANLRNITMSVKPGDFIGIVGPVGAGKSTLLHLILGELTPSQGSVSVGNASMSFASQEPWLFAGTARENILFGLPYEEKRYNEVVTACALAKDFELLSHGDLTLVGERGVSLSGGQRARVALARACYREADIYLLDDPLSAVDTQVGQHIVSQCVQGVLRSATRLLVTHQLHHLKHAQHIVVMGHGEIEIQGSFDEVSQTPLFTEILNKNNDGKDPKAEEHLTAIQAQNADSEKADGAHEEEEETEEMTSSGRVSGAVYVRYFRAGGNWCLLSITVLGLLIGQVATSFSDLWLTHWMNVIERNFTKTISTNTSLESIPNATLSPNNITTTESSFATVSDVDFTSTLANITELLNNTSSETIQSYRTENLFFIYVWAIGIVTCTIIVSARSILFLWICMRSSVKLHNKMFSNILGATMRFFDVNSSGRILNRFAKDMGAVDELLPRLYQESLQILLVMIGIIVMVAIVNPYMLMTTVVCGIVMYFWTLIYLTTAQAIKRLEAVTRSPVFSHVTATMSGLSTVRASHAQELLVTQFDDKQDVHTAAWYLTLAANTAYALWLSLIYAFYVMVVSYSFLFLDDGTTKSGSVGLAISQGLILVNMVQYGVKQGTEVVSQMTSVERVLQFTSLPQETIHGMKPLPEWPKQAKVVFKNLSLRYSEDAEPVLKNLNLVIESGWKVGVVGRTGAGKSSLIAALFRLALIEGEIYIDDVNTKEVTLQGLRSKIAIIPQEPVLFSASLRYNMDPFDKYSDAEIWNVLEQVELKSCVTSLDMDVTSGGSNFSAGQRQLLCLARAALARNKLLVLDEATANVDPSTDALIQKSIRKHFADCTVITVAHRLHTVADSDQVIVMEAGKIVECGHPHELLFMENGYFTNMVKQLGGPSEQSVREISKMAFSKLSKTGH